MSSVPCQGSHSVPPPERQYALALVSTPEPPVAQVAPVVQVQLPAPQPAIVEEAPPGSLDSVFEYWIEAEDVPEVNSIVCIVYACTQVSRPSSRPGSAAASPCPLVGVRIEAIITGAEPVFQASSHQPPSQSPPPPPVYPDSTPRGPSQAPSDSRCSSPSHAFVRRALAGATSYGQVLVLIVYGLHRNRHDRLWNHSGRVTAVLT